MNAGRLCRPKWADTAFSGEGARIAGGRWNERGTRMVYCAETLSLCALELLVHLDPSDAPDFVAIPVEVPAEFVLRVEDVEALPADWRDTPAPATLADLGSRWIASGRSAALSVPSAIIPEERNLLLAPGHPEFARVRVGPPRPFAFDPRLLAG